MCTCKSSFVTVDIVVESPLKAVVKGLYCLPPIILSCVRQENRKTAWMEIAAQLKRVEGIKSSQHSTSPLLFPLHSLDPSIHTFFYLTNEGERVPTSHWWMGRNTLNAGLDLSAPPRPSKPSPSPLLAKCFRIRTKSQATDRRNSMYLWSGAAVNNGLLSASEWELISGVPSKRGKCKRGISWANDPDLSLMLISVN